MTPQEARTSNVVVKGTINLMGHIARLLFDPGAAYSFVFSAFASKLNMKPEPLKFQLVISTPIGAEMVTYIYYKECEVMIGEVKT